MVYSTSKSVMSGVGAIAVKRCCQHYVFALVIDLEIELVVTA